MLEGRVSIQPQPDLSCLYENISSAYQRQRTSSQNGPEPEEAKPTKAHAASPATRGSTTSSRHVWPVKAAVSPAEASGDT